MEYILTISGYFSQKLQTIQASIASSFFISLKVTEAHELITEFTKSSTSFNCSGVTFSEWVKSNLNLSAVMLDHAWWTWFPRVFLNQASKRWVAVWYFVSISQDQPSPHLNFHSDAVLDNSWCFSKAELNQILSTVSHFSDASSSVISIGNQYVSYSLKALSHEICVIFCPDLSNAIWNQAISLSNSFIQSLIVLENFCSSLFSSSIIIASFLPTEA